MVRKIILILFFIYGFNLTTSAQNAKVVYDSIISLTDLDKIKSIRTIIKYSKNCQVYQVNLIYHAKGMLKGEALYKHDCFETDFNKYLERCKFKKGDFFIVEFIKASCQPLMGTGYKFKIK